MSGPTLFKEWGRQDDLKTRHSYDACCNHAYELRQDTGHERLQDQISSAEASKDLIDPSSAQFRDVRVGRNGVCGQINAKNRMGAYVGYSRWVASATKTQPSGWIAQIDPQVDDSDVAEAEEFCQSVRSSTYSSASTTSSACQRAEEKRAEKLMQTLFNGSWKMVCE